MKNNEPCNCDQALELQKTLNKMPDEIRNHVQQMFNAPETLEEIYEVYSKGPERALAAIVAGRAYNLGLKHAALIVAGKIDENKK